MFTLLSDSREPPQAGCRFAIPRRRQIAVGDIVRLRRHVCAFGNDGRLGGDAAAAALTPQRRGHGAAESVGAAEVRHADERRGIQHAVEEKDRRTVAGVLESPIRSTTAPWSTPMSVTVTLLPFAATARGSLTMISKFDPAPFPSGTAPP